MKIDLCSSFWELRFEKNQSEGRKFDFLENFKSTDIRTGWFGGPPETRNTLTNPFGPTRTVVECFWNIWEKSFFSIFSIWKLNFEEGFYAVFACFWTLVTQKTTFFKNQSLNCKSARQIFAFETRELTTSMVKPSDGYSAHIFENSWQENRWKLTSVAAPESSGLKKVNLRVENSIF